MIGASIDVDIATQQACERVVTDFSAHFDAGESEAMERLFAADGVWRRADGDITGRAQLRDFMNRRRAGIFVRHVLSNLRTTLIDKTHAVVDSYVTVYRFDFEGQPVLPALLDGPDLIARYHDRLVIESGAWKLAWHEATIDFKRPAKGAR